MTKTIMRAGLIALSLGLAMPTVQAAPFETLTDFLYLDGPGRVCLIGNGAIRRAIEKQGYTKVYLNVQDGRRIQSRATKGKWVYLLNVNACSGRVVERQKLRPA